MTVSLGPIGICSKCGTAIECVSDGYDYCWHCGGSGEDEHGNCCPICGGAREIERTSYVCGCDEDGDGCAEFAE